MIEIHLYGKLRRHASSTKASSESVLEVEPRDGETVRTLIERTGLARDDICHIFLNGRLLSTENSMAPWLEYRQDERGGLDTPLAKGDRLGLFARDMALLVV
jgi:molybdopterin converting factor small subunit